MLLLLLLLGVICLQLHVRAHIKHACKHRAAWLLAAASCNVTSAPVLANGAFVACPEDAPVGYRCTATCNRGYKTPPTVIFLASGRWSRLSPTARRNTCVPIGEGGSWLSPPTIHNDKTQWSWLQAGRPMHAVVLNAALSACIQLCCYSAIWAQVLLHVPSYYQRPNCAAVHAATSIAL
jgi:hypothetical protein